MIRLRVCLALIAVVLRASVAQAQSVTNPSSVAFTPSVDHAQVTVYELGYFAAGAEAPTQAATIAKAALSPDGNNTYTFAFPRLLFGNFEVRLRACAESLCSPWAAADKAVTVVPFAPAAVTLR